MDRDWRLVSYLQSDDTWNPRLGGEGMGMDFCTTVLRGLKSPPKEYVGLLFARLYIPSLSCIFHYQREESWVDGRVEVASMPPLHDVDSVEIGSRDVLWNIMKKKGKGILRARKYQYSMQRASAGVYGLS